MFNIWQNGITDTENPLVQMLIRNGYQNEYGIVFWWKDYKTKNGNTITMYIPFLFLQTANELTLFKEIKRHRERAKKYYL